jgi:Fe-S-cluster containining protein
VKEGGADPKEFLEFVTPEEIQGVTKSDPTWLEVDDERYMMALRRGPMGCHFLNKRTKKCKIYESRPLLCRLYPFKVQETRDGEYRGFTLHSDVGCPKHQDGVVETDQLYELYEDDSEHHETYDDLVEAFNKKDYPDKQPQDFVKMFLTVKRKKKKKSAK